MFSYNDYLLILLVVNSMNESIMDHSYKYSCEEDSNDNRNKVAKLLLGNQSSEYPESDLPKPGCLEEAIM